MLRSFLAPSALLLLASLQAFAQLHSADNQADYIIVSSRRLESQALQDFEQYRRTSGVTVKTVFVEDIYAEFPDSSKSSSIRQFCTYAMSHWKQPSVQYMLLAGGVQYVPSNVIAADSTYIAYGETEVSIDALYAVNSEQADLLQDLALGRLPANNPVELGTMLAKTIRYEKEALSHIGDKDILFVSDKNDGEIFDQTAQDQMANLSNLHCSHISFYPSSKNYGSRSDMLAAITQNPKVLMYIGHGTPYQWSVNEFLVAQNITTDIHNSFPFFYFSQTSRQNFDDTTKPNIVHEFLSLENGAVATVASSGITFAYLSAQWNSRLIHRILHQPTSSVGMCIKELKNLIAIGGVGGDDPYNRYTLLGDPYIKLHFDITASVGSDSSDNVSLSPCEPSVVNSVTRLRYSLPANGHVVLSLSDLMANTVITLQDEGQSAGEHSLVYDASNIADGMYICRLEFAGRVVWQKMLVVH